MNEELKKKIEDILANTEEGKAAAAGKAFGARHVMWVTDEIMKIVDGQGLSRSRVAQVAAFEMLDTAFHLLKAIGTKHAEVTDVIDLIRQRVDINQMHVAGKLTDEERRACLNEIAAPFLNARRQQP